MFLRQKYLPLVHKLVRAFFFENDGDKSSDFVNRGQYATRDAGVDRLVPFGFDFPRTDGIDINVDNDRGTPFEFQPDVFDYATSMFFHFQFNGITSSNEFTLSGNVTSSAFTIFSVNVADTTPDDGLPHTLLCTCSRDAGLFVYLDGVFLGSDVAAGSAEVMNSHFVRYDSNANQWEVFVTNATGGNRTNIMIGGTPQKIQDRWDGPIYAALYWHRKLNLADAKWLHNNYRLLRRPIPLNYGLSAAAAAAQPPYHPESQRGPILAQ